MTAARANSRGPASAPARWPLAVVALSAVPLVAAVAFRVIVAWPATPRALSALTPDDAYYYFGVARHLAAGLGSTYDGVAPTNGYQPLWPGPTRTRS